MPRSRSASSCSIIERRSCRYGSSGLASTMSRSPSTWSLTAWRRWVWASSWSGSMARTIRIRCDMSELPSTLAPGELKARPKRGRYPFGRVGQLRTRRTETLAPHEPAVTHRTPSDTPIRLMAMWEKSRGSSSLLSDTADPPEAGPFEFRLCRNSCAQA